MEEKKQPTGAEEHNTPEAPVADGPGTTPAQPAPGDVVVPFEKIEELMAEQRAAARHAVEQAEPLTPEAPTPSQPEKATEQAPEEKPQEEVAAEQKKPRRGRPPKAEKAEQAAPEADKEQTAAKPRRGRPPKADKAAPDEAQPPKPRDKVSQGKKAATVKEAPAPEQAAAGGGAGPGAGIAAEPQTPTPPPRPVEEGKLVYLKLSELHPFHTFRPHPFKVTDDAKMQETVASIKANGVMVPGLARPEKDGNGFEIIAGHRRTRGSELAGLEEMPFIVRDMTDQEAVQAMRDSNKQRDQTLPSELASLLDLEVEAIKHQGGRLDGVAPGDVGKRSVEIVGEAHDMNYKKVMRYPSFLLTNNNANIRRVRQRIDDLKNRSEFVGWTFPGGEAKINEAENRLQLLFDEKPPEDQRRVLKSEGFKWAPSQGAWQRQLNQNAIRAAARLDFLRPEDGQSPYQLQPFARKAEKDMSR